MGWWSALFSSKRIVDEAMDTVKGIRQGIDHIVYTDQEKAEMGLKISQIILERVQLALQESSFRSMSRRIISVLIVVQCIILTNILVLLYCFDAPASMMQGIWQLLNFWKVGLAIVIAFYLGYYGWAEIKKIA